MRAIIKRTWTEYRRGRPIMFAVGEVGGLKWEAFAFGATGGWEVTTPLSPEQEAEVRAAFARVGGGRGAVERVGRKRMGQRRRRVDSERRSMEGDDE